MQEIENRRDLNTYTSKIVPVRNCNSGIYAEDGQRRHYEIMR